jgi:hypothetical protein
VFRIDLCLRVDRGDLAVSQATEIFENIRSALINVKERDKQRERGCGGVGNNF